MYGNLLYDYETTWHRIPAPDQKDGTTVTEMNKMLQFLMHMQNGSSSRKGKWSRAGKRNRQWRWHEELPTSLESKTLPKQHTILSAAKIHGTNQMVHEEQGTCGPSKSGSKALGKHSTNWNTGKEHMEWPRCTVKQDAVCKAIAAGNSQNKCVVLMVIKLALRNTQESQLTEITQPCIHTCDGLFICQLYSLPNLLEETDCKEDTPLTLPFASFVSPSQLIIVIWIKTSVGVTHFFYTGISRAVAAA